MKLNIQLFAEHKVVIEADLDIKSVDRKLAELKYKLADLEKEYEKLQKTPIKASEKIPMLQEYEKKISDVKNEIAELEKQEEEFYKAQSKKTDLTRQQVQLNQSTKEYGNTLKSGLKSLTKMGLAIFSIRSAYMLIRQMTSRIAENNEDIANKLSTVKNALANLLTPIVEYLVNLVYKFLSYLNVITKKFLGIDLFKKSAKSAKNAVGSANKLKKTLAGFDEMNILSDTSGGGGGAGGGGALDPFDTGDFSKWLDNRLKMWDELLKIDRNEMARMLLQQDKTWGLLKLGWFDTIQGIARFITGFFKTLKALWDTLKALFNGDKKALNDAVKNLVDGIKMIVVGLFQTIGGLLEMILGTVWGVVKTIHDWIDKHIISPIINGFTNAFKTVVNFFSNVVNSIMLLFKNIGHKGGEIIASAFKGVVNAVLSSIERILNTPIRAINSLITAINKVPGVNLGKLSTFSLPRLAKGGIINMPGRGVPLAVGGEKGQEGVIPLTDSQQMALLGEAIGRYITINANITNTMNGRVISRELQKIQQEDLFASNR